jgi:hypothetical protein
VDTRRRHKVCCNKCWSLDKFSYHTWCTRIFLKSFREVCSFLLHTFVHGYFPTNSSDQQEKSKRKISFFSPLFWNIWDKHLTAFFCKWLLCLRREINWFP